MKKEILHYKTDFLFPLSFRIFGYILALAAILVSVEMWWLGVPILLLAIFLSYSFEGYEFNLSQKEYRRCYVFFFAVKTGSWSAYKSVEKLFIKSSTYSQQINSRVSSGPSVRYIRYKLFVKFENGKKELVLIQKQKNKLEQKAQQLAKLLMCDLEDLSKM